MSNHEAMEAGADHFVLKRSIVTDFLAAIDAVRAGRSYVSPDIADSPPRKPPRKDSPDARSPDYAPQADGSGFSRLDLCARRGWNVDGASEG